MGANAFSQEAPDYEAAARFSQKAIARMVFSTSVTPNWFKDSDKFWYSYKTPAGTRYYIVDPATGSKTEAFDMEKLAMEVTSIVHDPFDAQHLPLTGLELKDDKVFRFDVRSTLDVPDTTALKKDPKSKKTVKKVYHFEYDIASKKLKEYEPEEREYPAWASVSPDGLTGVYAKDNNLWWMDKENMKKAAKDEKDSTLVEHQLTFDGIRDYGYGYGKSYGSGYGKKHGTRYGEYGEYGSKDQDES